MEESELEHVQPLVIESELLAELKRDSEELLRVAVRRL